MPLTRGEAFRPSWSARALFLDNVLAGQPHWCDDVRTPFPETCAALLASSFEKAIQDLQKRYGEARSEYVPMITERRRLEADGAQRLVLAPR